MVGDERLMEKYREVNGLRHHNIGKAYDLIKTLRKGSQPRQRNNKDTENQVLTDLHGTLKRWKEYGKAQNYNDGDDSAHEHLFVMVKEYGKALYYNDGDDSTHEQLFVIQEAIMRLT